MDQRELVQHAWALTEAIEAAAEAQDWTRAAELAQARSPLVMAFEADQPEESITTIRRIQASMESMMGRTEAAQAMLALAYRKSMDQTQAAKRYQNAAWL
jgi:flagellar protein FliT